MPESLDEHYPWEGAVVGCLTAIELGAIRGLPVITEFGEMFISLVKMHAFDGDFGEVQQYLRNREAVVQLVAHPYDRRFYEPRGIVCRDIITGEPRNNWLMVCVGYSGVEQEKQMAQIGISHEQNEGLLAYDTGMLQKRSAKNN